MKHILLLGFGLIFSLSLQAQFVSNEYQIIDDMQERIKGDNSKLNKKAKANPKNCGKDTITYPYYKASRLVTINVSNGYSLGQFYEAPSEFTIDGFEFYAWQTGGNKDTVVLYCDVYKAGPDSLPTGSPLRSDTLLIDSSFGGGSLSVLRQSAEFKALKYDSAYVLVLSSRDTGNNVAVVTNDYAANDGDLENLGCGSISNLWYHFLDLNISGRTLNCDVLIHPYVSYQIYNDFTFTDCYTTLDTVKLKNTSSSFYSSRMYNRYTFFNLEYICHQYLYENRYYVREVDGVHKYNTQINDTVRLISTLYTLTGARTCIDTVYKPVTYMPTDVIFSGNRDLCSGDFTIIRTNTNADVEWFNTPTDTAPFLSNQRLSTPFMYANDTFYAQAVNGSCRTPLKRLTIDVTEKPDIPVVTHDSVCLNSKANLSATSSVGTMLWYSDSSSANLVYTGEVLQTGDLKNDTSFFVQAVHKKCKSEGFVKVNALVGKDFAPTAPVVTTDTNICLLEGAVVIRASASDPIRWFNQPSGGSPFQNGGAYNYTPTSRGTNIVYVDAYDSRCASSRVQVKINTLHFPTIANRFDIKICEDEVFFINFDPLDGTIDWFDGQANPNPNFTGTSRGFGSADNDQVHWLQPREGFCLDTVRHHFVLETTKKLHPDFAWNPTACSGDSLELKSDHTGGTTIWMNSNDSILFRGNPFSTGPLKTLTAYKLFVENDGCIGDTIEFPVEVFPAPSSNYDFQINTFRSVLFQAKVANQNSYLWDFDDLGQTKTGRLVNHDFSDDRDFNVQLKVTSNEGCKDSTAKLIRIENTGSVEVPENKFAKVYPNPVEDELNIKLTGQHNYNKIEVLDFKGSTLFETEVIPNKISNFWLNTSSLSTGTYIVRFTGADSMAQELVIKQ
jgi:hypothetical protein